MSRVTIGVLDKLKQTEVIENINNDVVNSANYVIFVSANTIAQNLMKLMNEKTDKADKTLFIDCVSKRISSDSEIMNNCVYIDGPQNLTAISIAVMKAVNELPGKKVVLIDSISTLLFYNDEMVIARFLNYMINILKSKETDVLFLLMKQDENRSIIKHIEYYSDEVKQW